MLSRSVFDDEFLYVAARCNKLPKYPYRPTNEARKTRSRDAELINRDRIEIALDTDRDYSAFLQFSVDHRGWCCDSFSGSKGWDPEWFVAQSEDEKSWSIELAIPSSQLTSSKIEENVIWGISLSRRVGRNSPNLWPTRSIDFADQDVGLHRVSQLAADQFELLRFGF